MGTNDESETGVYQEPTATQPAKDDPRFRRRSRIAWIVVGLIIVSFAVFVGLPTSRGFVEADKQVEAVRHHVLDPSGAIERGDTAYGPTFRGAPGGGGLSPCGISAIVPIGGHCPRVERTWWVPIQPGDDEGFAEATLKNEGFTLTTGGRNTCQEGRTTACGVKGKTMVSITMVEPGTLTPPTQDVSPKTWRLLALTADYYIW